MEYFADTSPRVQYLMPRRNVTPRQPFRLFWKYPMPILHRFGLAMISLAGILFCLVLLSAMTLIAWSFLFPN